MLSRLGAGDSAGIAAEATGEQGMERVGSFRIDHRTQTFFISTLTSGARGVKRS